MKIMSTLGPTTRIVRAMRARFPATDRPAPVRWEPSFTGGWPYR